MHPADIAALVIDAVGRFHPLLVHFPIALVVTALVAEVLYALRKNQDFGTAALFLITAAAWTSVPAFLAGFAAAAGAAFDSDLAGALVVHRFAGVAAPMLAFIAAGMGHSTRRSGQVWEQMVYRAFLGLAAVAVGVAGLYGGRLVHGAGYLWR
jgi:uncharacterized membrane protein